MINSLLNEYVQLVRRIATSTDSLGNPVYGSPVTGSGWNTVYLSMPVRLAFTDTKIEFVLPGERVRPSGTMYYQATYNVLQEDRIITPQNIQYVVISTRIAYKTGSVIDHMEAVLDLV